MATSGLSSCQLSPSIGGQKKEKEEKQNRSNLMVLPLDVRVREGTWDASCVPSVRENKRPIDCNQLLVLRIPDPLLQPVTRCLHSHATDWHQRNIRSGTHSLSLHHHLLLIPRD